MHLRFLLEVVGGEGDLLGRFSGKQGLRKAELGRGS